METSNGAEKQPPIESFIPDEQEKSNKFVVDVEEDTLFHYDVYDKPNIIATVGFAMQQVLMSLSRSLSTSLLVADVVCARTDEHYKAKLLSTTLFISGITTFLQSTIGVRMPLYQGPAATYVIPLIAMSSQPAWKCPDIPIASNMTVNNSTVDLAADIQDKTSKLAGSLMIAGTMHMLFGMLGLVGVLIRFVGPITIIPALSVVGLIVYKAAVKFAKTQFAISMLTLSLAVIFSFYLAKVQLPVPVWSRKSGLHFRRYPVQKMFSVLLACLLGWGLSGILTGAGVFSDDPNSDTFYARTDSRLHVVRETGWFYIPYPGHFGPPGFEVGALVTFIMGTISSIIDSVGDYYACSKVCHLPPPPNHAVNRGIAIEGLMSFIGGWSGAGHATSTFGGNIGAIGITRVASLRVFQTVGIIYILFGIVSKIGAVFVTIPYSVVGGMMMVNFGVLIGVMLSNMQFIDMNSTRNLAAIGLSLLLSQVIPYWLETTPGAISTGSDTVDNILQMLLINPVFVAAVIACFLDNTLPGSRKERGMEAWQADLGLTDDGESNLKQTQRLVKVKKTVYTLPGTNRLASWCPCLKYIPIFPK